MASTSKCPYCDSTIRSTDQRCPNCGAQNPNYVADTPRTVFLPKTVEELKEYCAERGMPLLRMRFFLGEDFREPRAFGIYRDGTDFVVYKNKSDGSRAVRYRGPDEAHAVDEIFTKLLEECHNRGIYPDGAPTRSSSPASSKATVFRKASVRIVLLFVVFVLLAGAISSCNHRRDGYYQLGSGPVYYHYGSDWYYSSGESYSDGWYEAPSFPSADYTDYYLGDDYDSDWGVSDFKHSSTWDSIQSSSSSSSSDFDSWDSSDTDWDSDW